MCTASAALRASIATAATRPPTTRRARTTPARGLQGRAHRAGAIATCARCHSDADLMRRSRRSSAWIRRPSTPRACTASSSPPATRNVATCASCHGAARHPAGQRREIAGLPHQRRRDLRGCHANARTWPGTSCADGIGAADHQFADYQKSVHYAALTKGNDLSAPTCNDCHGNHGATPPGVGAVANVCGTCHAVFAQKFQTSVHAQIFDKGCVECHGNHAVLQPSDEMLGADRHGHLRTLPRAATGRQRRGRRRRDARGLEQLKAGIEQSGALIARVRNAGIEVSDEELALREAATKLTLARTEMHGVRCRRWSRRSSRRARRSSRA